MSLQTRLSSLITAIGADIKSVRADIAAIPPRITDHGALTGLADDDHTQYPLIILSATQPTTTRVGAVWVQT